MRPRPKRAVAAVSMLVLCATVVLYAFTDDFAGTGTDPGPNWSTMTDTDPERNVGILIGAGVAAFLCSRRSGDGAYGPLHYSKIQVVTVIDNDSYVMVGVNASTDSTTATFDGYVLHTDGTGGTGQFSLLEVVNGGSTEIGHYSETIAGGDTIKLARLAGDVLQAYKNDVEIACDGGASCSGGVVTDATLTGGYPSICMFDSSEADNWVGETIGGTTPRGTLLGVLP